MADLITNTNELQEVLDLLVGKRTDAVDNFISGQTTDMTSYLTNVPAYGVYQRNALTTISFPEATGIYKYGVANNASLTSISFPKLTTMYDTYAFANNTALTSINLPLLGNVQQYAFSGCSALKTIKLPKVRTVSSYAFQGCTELNTIDLGVATTIQANAMADCGWLKALILRSPTKVTLSNVNALSPDARACYIYVPKVLLISYNNDTNWSTFFSYLRPLENYTIDGTVDGELDPEKI